MFTKKEYKLLTIYPDNTCGTSSYSHAQSLIDEHVNNEGWSIEKMLPTGKPGEILVVFVRQKKGAELLND